MLQKAIGSAPDRVLPVPWFLTPKGYEQFKASRWVQAWELMRREPRLHKRCWTCMRQLTEPKEKLPAWPDLDRPSQQAFKQDQRSFLADVGFRPSIWSAPLRVTFNCTVPRLELLDAFREEIPDPSPFATFMGADGEPATISADVEKLDSMHLDKKDRGSDRWKWSRGRDGLVNLDFPVGWTARRRLAHFREFLQRSPSQFRLHRAEQLQQYGAKPFRKPRTRAKSIALGLAFQDAIAPDVVGARFSRFSRYLAGLSKEQLHTDFRVVGVSPKLPPEQQGLKTAGTGLQIPRLHLAPENAKAVCRYAKRIRESWKQVRTLSDRFSK